MKSPVMATDSRMSLLRFVDFEQPCHLLLIVFGLLGVCKSSIVVYPEITEVGQIVNVTCIDTVNTCRSGSLRIVSSKDPNVNLSGVVNAVQYPGEIQLQMHVAEPQKIDFFCLCEVDNATYLVDLHRFEAGYLPSPAVNFTCISLAWEDLECKWDQEEMRSSLQTTTWTVTFTVTILDTGAIARSLQWALENRTCLVDQQKLTCQINPDETLKQKLYSFSVVAENSIGSAISSFNVTTDEAIVKPPSPTNFSATTITVAALNTTVVSNTNTSDCAIRLSWTSGGADLTTMFAILTRKGLQHRVSYIETSRKRLRSQMIVSMDVDVSMELTNLRPFVEYTAVITSRVAKLGTVWSDPVSLNFSTCETAPAVSPVVSSWLGFSYEDDMDCRGQGQGGGVTLYWQGIPEVSGLSNGIVTGYYILDGEKVVAETGGRARQKSLCMQELDGITTYKLVGATAVGKGVQTSEIYVPRTPPTQQLRGSSAGLRLRPCDISVMKKGLHVEILWTLLQLGAGTNFTQEKSSYSSGTVRRRLKDIDQQRYVVFWCQFDGRSQCTGDIMWSPAIRARQQWPHNQTVGQYQVNFTTGSVYEYRFGVALSTPSNITGGITWAGCVHSTDGERSKVPDPQVTHLYDDVYSVKIRQLECFRGGLELPRPIKRVLYWCNILEHSNGSCNFEKGETLSCCNQESTRSLVLNGCDHDTMVRGGGSGVAAWVKHVYSEHDYAMSSVDVWKPAIAEPQRADDVMWSSAVICGTAVGVTCIVAIIAVLIRTYLRMATMDVRTITKVPPVAEVLVRDDYVNRQEIFGSEDGLYSQQAGHKTKSSRSLLDCSMPTRGVRRLREKPPKAAHNAGYRGVDSLNDRHHYVGDSQSTSTGYGEEYVGRCARAGDEPLSVSQTCVGFAASGDDMCPLPITEGLSSRIRYIWSPKAEDALYRTATQAATAKLQILNWLPMPKSSITSLRQHGSTFSDYFPSDCAGRTSVSELSDVRRPCSTLNAGCAKEYVTSNAEKLLTRLDIGAASAGVSCPTLTTYEEVMGADRRSQAGASSQMTASTSCSSLGYWKASQEGHEDRPLSTEAIREAAVVSAGSKRKMSAEEEYFEARALSSVGRQSIISLVSSSAKLKPCLDYI